MRACVGMREHACACVRMRVRACHLPSRLDALPHTEVADDPGEDETQGQLPPQAAHLLDAPRHLQGPPPGGRPRDGRHEREGGGGRDEQETESERGDGLKE